MKKLSESIFNAGIKRNQGEEKRQEDKSPFDKGFEIIKNTELIDLGFDDLLWTPFNFGSDSIDKPGYYMTADEMVELNEYLKDTDFRIACNYDFSHLSVCKPDLMRIGDYWHYKFARNGQELDVPMFGYISFNSPNDEVVGTLKRDSAFFGCIDEYMPDKMFEYTSIKMRGSQFVCERHLNQVKYSEKLQVRLVKKIHKLHK